MKQNKLEKTPVTDEEFFRLELAYQQRRDLSRRSSERIDRPIDIKPSAIGNRIVNWQQYLEAVALGKAIYPPQPFGLRKI